LIKRGGIVAEEDTKKRSKRKIGRGARFDGLSSDKAFTAREKGGSSGKIGKRGGERNDRNRKDT